MLSHPNRTSRRGLLVLTAVLAMFAIATVFGGGGSSVTAQSSAPNKLRADLPNVLDSVGASVKVPITIVMTEQVPRDVIASMAKLDDRDERRELVTDTLRQVAEATQGELLAYLDEQQSRGTVGERIRTLWLTNVIGVDATADVVREIAARADVAYVNHNPKRDVFLEAKPEAKPAPKAGGPRGSTTCGVDLVRAPEVWADFSITGDGVVVSVIDTGVCYNHSDLQNQMWVNPGEDLDNDGVLFDPDDVNGIDDDGNGFVDDFHGWDHDNNDNDPMDQNGHGTHVAGTVAGDGSGGQQTGVAPGAKIMANRVGTSFSDEMDVWQAMQYAADNSADVISMSLGWPHSVAPDRATWRANCDNTIAAGTIMSIAAGNEGSCCRPFDAVRCPGSVPSVITVGAVDCGDTIASFSSRGPVTWQDIAPYNDFPYPPGLTKPTISGPGVSTTSAAVCSGYTDLSGTSMATPHNSGVIALMLEANPALTEDLVELILGQTAVDLGPAGQDEDYGFGRIDAYEAVTIAIDPPNPEIFSVSPDHGNNTNPTTVTITGEDFLGEVVVTWDGVPAPFANRINDTTIIASTPVSPVLGDVDLEISTFSGDASMTDAFEYLPRISTATTEVEPGDTVSFFVTGPFGGDWGMLMSSANGSKVFKGYTTCLAGGPDFTIVDHSIRTPSMQLNGSGFKTFEFEIPPSAQAGDTFVFQGLFDGNGPASGRPVFGSDCVTVNVN